MLEKVVIIQEYKNSYYVAYGGLYYIVFKTSEALSTGDELFGNFNIYGSVDVINISTKLKIDIYIESYMCSEDKVLEILENL